MNAIYGCPYFRGHKKKTILKQLVLLIALLSLMPVKSVYAQATTIYQNSFDSKSGLTYEITSGKGNSDQTTEKFIKVSSVPSIPAGMLSPIHSNYNGFIYTNTGINLSPGFTYSISLNVLVTGSDANLDVSIGNNVNEAKSKTTLILQKRPVSKSVTTPQTFTSTFTVTAPIQTLYLAIYVENIVSDINVLERYITIDDIIITKTCNTITAPTATDGSREGRGSVELRAAGAGTGHSYRWYNDDNTPISGENGSVYNTPTLTSTTKYKVSIVRDDTGCESNKVSVTATVNDKQETAPKLQIKSIDNGTKWQATVPENAFGASAFGSSPTYTWYRRESMSTTPAGEWGSAVQSNNQNTYIENAPNENVQLMAFVYNPETRTQYGAHNINQEPLPVEIRFFKAAKKGNDVELKWVTEMEKDNIGFAVEVSESGQIFREIAFINSTNGNCQTQQAYSYTDTENGKNGIRYYRLQQLDTNAAKAYSPTASVYFDNVKHSLDLYPNPVTGNEVKVSIACEEDGKLKLQLLNLAGKQVYTKTTSIFKGLSTQIVPLDPSWPKGIYILRSELGGKINNFKLIKAE